jgi:hypothetical protein
MTTGSTHAEAAQAQPSHPVSLGWVLRRAAVGILLITLLSGSIAWLTYESVGAADRATSSPMATGSLGPDR